MTSEDPILLRLRGVRKRYGATQALDGLDLAVRRGEVVGVAGPNGAGKSTLIRIIAGEDRADDGSVDLEGGDHAAETVALVHQEAQLFANLTVRDNLMAGREQRRWLRPRVGSKEQQLLSHLDLARVSKTLLGMCSLAVQQRTEIARALARDAQVFLFDEPNSALTDAESEELFREIQRLASLGRGVILVSHRLGDLVHNCDRVVILRNGRIADELAGAALTEEAVARSLVVDTESHQPGTEDSGDDGHRRRSEGGAQAAGLVLQTDGWSSPVGAFSDVQLEVRAGEIRAFVGVEGSGARELLRSLAGLERANGKLEIIDLAGGAYRGVAYVAATRRLSLFDNLDVGGNIVSRLDTDITRAGFVLSKKRMRAVASDAVKRFRVKMRTTTQGIRTLSGGNQQKVAIAAAIASRPRILLLEEPTRGVDISSKRDIYQLLRQYAGSGCAVILFCTEPAEVFDTADTVHVVSRGSLLPPFVVQHESIADLAAELATLAADLAVLEEAG